MSFSKLMALIHSRALHFTRIDQLQDRFEGAQPVPNLRNPGRLDEYVVLGDTTNLLEHQKGILAQALAAPHPLDRQVVAVNCWHMNVYESAAMWPLYVQGTEGVAIVSTVGKLKRAFDATPESVVIAVVKYIDHATDAIPRGNFLQAFLHKRKSFEHERELRALVFMPHNGDRVQGPVAAEGIDIQVELRVLVEAIHLAPGSPSWFENTVRATLKTLGYEDLPVRRSGLDEEPPS
jgi:hypothetical protein